ncbi:MAG: acetate/propionate family kinase [Enterobacteriaceae bacterium]
MEKKLVLVINCGSSSIKFALLNIANEKKIISGILEFNNNLIVINYIKKKKIYKTEIKIKKNKYEDSIKFIICKLLASKSYLNILAIGHRVVHGGNFFLNPILINKENLKELEKCSNLAPLHNPFNILGIKICLKIFPKLKKKNVAVFDTSFYKTIPKTSYMYAIPYNLYKKYNIRKYGAHGISHEYILNKLSNIIKKPIYEINFISCHLGNGSSVSVIKNGKCVDTSMGMTPLEGLIMGTRCGDIDPSIIFYLNKNLNYSINKIKNILNKKSGFLGITEKTNDCRYIEKNYKKNKKCKLAINMYVHRLAKYIASYTTLIKNIDAITFTGGIGENSSIIREKVIKKLEILKFYLEKKKNYFNSLNEYKIISKKKSRKIIIIHTEEELMIAKKAEKLVT